MIGIGMRLKGDGMEENKWESALMEKAIEAMRYAYAPYSDFSVGAALLAKSGKVYLGCNVENASFGATICAERTALVKAISEGEREFVAIAIACGARTKLFPCGICRQMLSEFGDIDVLIDGGAEGESGANAPGETTVSSDVPSIRYHILKYRLSELLLSSFQAEDMTAIRRGKNSPISPQNNRK